MTDSIHTDFTCSSCNTIATSLTECNHCHKWICQSCSKLPKSTLNKMTALQKSGFYWFCTNCRTDSRPSQRKILSNSSSQTSPMYTNNSSAPHLSPQPTLFTSSPLTPPPNPSSQTISESIPQSPPTHSLFLPSLLSPLAYPLLPLNDYNTSLPLINPPRLITFTAHAYLPYSPQNLIKLHGKELITPPTLHLLTFLSVNYQLSPTQSLEQMKHVTIQHT